MSARRTDRHTDFRTTRACGRSPILLVIFGALSLHPKIPFLAAGLERAKFDRTCTRNSDFWATVIRDLGPPLQLFRIESERLKLSAPFSRRIESERLKLSAPFSRRIAEPLDADAAGQATFYGRLDKIGCEEGERDGHIDLPNAAFLASAELCDRGHLA